MAHIFIGKKDPTTKESITHYPISNQYTKHHKSTINKNKFDVGLTKSLNPYVVQKISDKNYIPLPSTDWIKGIFIHCNNPFHMRSLLTKKYITKKLKRFKINKLNKKKLKAFFMCLSLEQMLKTSQKSNSGIINMSSRSDQPFITTDTSKNNTCIKEYNSDNKQQFINPIQNDNKSNDTIVCCNVCFVNKSLNDFIQWSNCKHSICLSCAANYIYQEVADNYHHQIDCHQCHSMIQPDDIKKVLYLHEIMNENSNVGRIIDITSHDLYDRYEQLCLERALLLIPNIRFCPGENCTNAVVADNCGECPKIKCINKNCGISFCYHCGMKWHPKKNCNEAITNQIIDNIKLWDINKLTNLYTLHKNIINIYTSTDFDQKLLLPNNIMEFESTLDCNNDARLCPTCRCVVVKENDGKCNLVKCNMCNTTFCWLCMQPANDQHYFGPNGCTYFGTKKWNNKQTMYWRIALMMSGPIWICCSAVFLLPIILFGFPAYSTNILNGRLETKHNKFKAHTLCVAYFFLITMISPLIYAVLISIGIPFAFLYTYFQIPLNIWRDKYILNEIDGEQNLQHKLSLSYLEEQLFLIHIRWIISELAQKYTNLDKMPSNKIQNLMSQYLKEQIELNIKNNSNQINSSNIILDKNYQLNNFNYSVSSNSPKNDGSSPNYRVKNVIKSDLKDQNHKRSMNLKRSMNRKRPITYPTTIIKSDNYKTKNSINHRKHHKINFKKRLRSKISLKKWYHSNNNHQSHRSVV